MLPKKSCLPSKRGPKKRLSFVFLACLSALAALFDGCVSRTAVENPEITFTIIQTNGQKEPASMASFIKEERSRSENLVLADNAGFFEQAGFSSFYSGGSLAPLKNAYKIMGYDAVYAGKAYIVKNFGEKKSALKIGIISGEQPVLTHQSAAGSFAKIEKTVRKLRIKEKCGIILLLLNAGEKRAELIAENVPGIDMILCGGTNPNYFEPWKVRQTMIASVKDSGRFAGKAEVTYEGSRITGLKWENIEINSKNFPPDEEINALMAPYKKEYAENLKKPLFELTENLEFGKRLCRKYDSRLGGFIADMQEQFVENLVKPVDRLGIFSGGIDFSIINGGSIRCGLNKGNITA